MQFGLHYAPEMFQETIEVIFASVEGKLILFYLDATSTFSEMPERHIYHVKQVLALLRRARVKQILKDFISFTETIIFFGYLIDRNS